MLVELNPCALADVWPRGPDDMPDGHMQLSFRYETIGTLMPVAQKTISHFPSVFSATVSRSNHEMTSLTHEEIRSEYNNHLKTRRQENSPEMYLKPPSFSKSQGTRTWAPQEQTLTVSAAAPPGMSREKPASWPVGALGGPLSQRSPRARPRFRRSPLNLARASSHRSTSGR